LLQWFCDQVVYTIWSGRRC